VGVTEYQLTVRKVTGGMQMLMLIDGKPPEKGKDKPDDLKEYDMASNDPKDMAQWVQKKIDNYTKFPKITTEVKSTPTPKPEAAASTPPASKPADTSATASEVATNTPVKPEKLAGESDWEKKIDAIQGNQEIEKKLRIWQIHIMQKTSKLLTDGIMMLRLLLEENQQILQLSKEQLMQNLMVILIQGLWLHCSIR